MHAHALASNPDFALELVMRDGGVGLIGVDVGAAEQPIALAENAHGMLNDIRAVSNVGEALKEALDLVDGNQVVLVTGSIFVAASARIAWFENIL